MQTALKFASLKRAANVIGTILCLIAVALLIKRGIELGGAVESRLAHIPPLAFAVSFALYAAGSVLLGAAWVLLVRIATGRRTRSRTVFVAHLRSQIAKYLPGNIFHLAYRHIATRSEDVGHRALAAALALESVLVIAAGAVMSIGVVSDPRLGEIAPSARSLIWVGPVLAVVVWIVISRYGHHFGLARRSMRSTVPAVAAVFVIYLVFFALAASALRLLCDDPAVMSFAAWCGWLAVAWVIGYVTPGAPAGIGLRELVLVTGLSPLVGDVDAMAIALSYRLVTVLADAAVAGIGFLLPNTPTATGATAN